MSQHIVFNLVFNEDSRMGSAIFVPLVRFFRILFVCSSVTKVETFKRRTKVFKFNMFHIVKVETKVSTYLKPQRFLPAMHTIF
jgi:hypothetical protein